MSVKESDFNRRMRLELEEHHMFRIDRIESHSLIGGIPDDAFLHKPSGIAGWIEVKEEAAMPSRIRYRPKQALWLYEYSMAGGICCTVVHVIDGDRALVIPGRFSLQAEKNITPLLRDHVAAIPLTKRNVCWSILTTAIIGG